MPTIFSLLQSLSQFFQLIQFIQQILSFFSLLSPVG